MEPETRQSLERLITRHGNLYPSLRRARTLWQLGMMHDFIRELHLIGTYARRPRIPERVRDRPLARALALRFGDQQVVVISADLLCISEELHLDYRTMRHHLDVLTKNHILARPEGKAYGSMYFVSGAMDGYMDVFSQIRDSVAGDSVKILAKSNKKTEG